MRRLTTVLALLALIPASAPAQDKTRTFQRVDENGKPIGEPKVITIPEHGNATLKGELVDTKGNPRSPEFAIPDHRSEPKAPPEPKSAPEPKPAPEPKETPGLVPEDR